MSAHNFHFADEVDCYLHDVLNPDEKRRFEEHLQDCESCRAALEEGKKRLDAVKNVVVSEADDGLVTRTLQKIDGHEKSRIRWRTMFRRSLLGVAAAVVMLYVGAQLYQASLKPSPYDLRVFGQTQFFVNADAQLHVAVVERPGRLASNVPVRVEIAGPNGDVVELARCKTDIEGNAQPSFRLPPYPEGSYRLRVTASPGGTPQAASWPIQLRSDWKPASASASFKVMLSSDRPVYQPGQTIHVRSLSLRTLDLKPVGGQAQIFTISDPKDNIIFKHTDGASKFGIASCDCVLARDILEGPYTVQCRVGDAPPQKLQVEVRKYVLPKFKIDVAFDSPFFLPGDKITGKVHAHYFFGKPVGGAQVELELEDGQTKLTASTNADGEAAFEFKNLARRHWDKKAKVLVLVTDSAGQAQSRTVPLILATEPFHIEMIPESGALIAGVPNAVYVLAACADGSPAQVSLAMFGQKGLERELQTNELGFAQFSFTPVDAQAVAWKVEIQNKQGQSSTALVYLGCEAGLLLRTDKAVYRGGEVVHLEAVGRAGPQPNPHAFRDGELFVDVIKDGRILWTQTLARSNKKFSADVQLPADMFGTVELRARYPQSPTPTRGSAEDNTQPSFASRPRIIQVRPPGEVRIATSMDRQEYRPNTRAELAFRLTDRNDVPIAGALSLSAVDEAVFSVLQQRPGSEASFFGASPPFVSTSLEAPVGAEDRQLFERAVVAKTLTPSSRVDAANRTEAFSASTYETNVRVSEEKKRAFAGAMATVWRILGTMALVALGCVAIYFVVLFFVTLGKGSPKTWGLGFAGMAVIVVFVIVLGKPLILKDQLLGLHGGAAAQGEASTDRVPKPVPPDKVRVGGVKNIFGSKAPSRRKSSEPPEAKGKPEKGGVTRVREWFPETLLWRPELITNDRGEARLSLDLADSITTWRLSASAVSGDGRLGASTAQIKVFQPFFVDVQLPVALTRGDEVAVPVVVYNYVNPVDAGTGRPAVQQVVIKVSDADWFELLDQPEKRLTLQPEDRTRSTSFRIRARKAGSQVLTVAALSKIGDTTHADAIKRAVDVVPDGRPVEMAWNGTLLQPAHIDFGLPADAVEDSARLLLKIYPSTFSQVLEGLDSIFRMPSGCFEQTSSTTYPNVLALDYLRRTNQRMPKVEEKARGYIHKGYQRLLSFEVEGGGFDWFGRAPANRTLTAYGLLEFQDMARVHEIDPEVIGRTRRWLLHQREDDGSWLPEGHVPAGLPGGHGAGKKMATLAATSYIAWAVFHQEQARDRAEPTRRFIQSHRPADIDDPHVLALAANALLAMGADAGPYLSRLEILKESTPDGKQVFWRRSAGARTLFHGQGQSGQVETTALAVLALMQRGGEQHAIVNSALAWLIGQRDPHGTWHSTQATVLALKALLAGNLAPAALERRIVIAWADGRERTVPISADQAEVMKLIDDLTPELRPGKHRLTIRDTSDTGAGYQLTLRYHEPAANRPRHEPFLIQVRYEKDKLQVGDVVPVLASVSNLRKAETAPMVMVELPLPPGFEVRGEDWSRLVEQQRIAKYQIEAQRILVYLRELGPGQEVKLPYRLEAKMPLRIQVPAARAYEYYDPSQTASSSIAALTVLPRAD